MFKIILLQTFLVLLALGVALAWFGLNAGLSVGWGGLVCIIPNTLLALRLTVQARRPGGVHFADFMIGEFAKLLLAVALLWAIVAQYPSVNWLGLLLGLIIALKSYWLMFLFRIY